MSLPYAHLTDNLQIFSDAWTRLLAAALWRSDLRPPAIAIDARGHTAEISWAPSTVPNDEGRDVIWYGDKLKVTFFESLGVTLGSGSGANSDHVVDAVFPRMDLSAEYAIDDSGRLNLPKLGRFATIGQTITALQSELAAAFERAIGRTADVHIDIIERQPIYVVGPVRNAGTFKHTPGMIVLQALADAGGIDLGVADTSKAIENIRETGRLRQAEDKLDRLLVKQARLIAQRDNSDTIVVPGSIKSRLSETAGEGLNALIAGAAATLMAERKSYQQQLSLAERQVRIARLEIEAQNMRADQLKDLLAKKQGRLHELEGIAARGSVSQYKLIDMNVDISELVARQEDLRVALAQAERLLAQAEIVQARTELDYSVGLEKELATTKQDIDDCTEETASMQAVTVVLRNSLPEAAGGSAGSHPNLRITRRVATGFAVIPATEMTVLLPGDVVQVNSDGRSGAPISGLAQNMSHLQMK